jgi:hypothetical protein
MDSQAAQAHTDPNILPETKHTSTIHLHGNVLTGKLITSLRNEINTLRITNYYKKKFGENHDKVLWDVFYSAVSHFRRMPKRNTQDDSQHSTNPAGSMSTTTSHRWHMLLLQH